jgi:hypothetical protein
MSLKSLIRRIAWWDHPPVSAFIREAPAASQPAAPVTTGPRKPKPRQRRRDHIQLRKAQRKRQRVARRVQRRI